MEPYNLRVGPRARALRSILLVALAAFVLGVWAARAWSARWIADDFCFANASRVSFWRSQATTYATWTGRYTATFLAEVLTRLGPGSARWIAIGGMLVWLAAAWRATRRFDIACGFVAAIVNAAPDAYQPLIWTTGLVTYGLPVIGATAIAAMIDAPAVLLFVMALIFGGCSEVAALAQVVLATALAIVVPRVRRKLIAVAGGSAIAFAIVVLAPGNFLRREHFRPMTIPGSTIDAIANTPAVYTGILVEGCTLFVPLLVVLALANSRVSWRVAGAALIASIIVVTATLFGGFVGTGALPWARVQFIPIAYIAAALMFAGLAFRIEKYATLATIAMIAFAAICVVTTPQLRIDEIRESRRFAAAADLVASVPRGTHVMIAAPHHFEYLEFVSRDPNRWTNRCMADYYGLRSIRSSR